MQKEMKNRKFPNYRIVVFRRKNLKFEMMTYKIKGRLFYAADVF